MKRFAVLLALLGVSVVSSLLVPAPAPREPARAGGYWVLEGDMHVHTSFVGALATPLDIPLLARRRELDFVAVTEHNAWFGGALTRLCGSWLAPDVVVLPSEELTNRAYHVLAIGLSSRIDPRLPLSAIAAETHRQGGLLIAAHPTRNTWPLLLGLAAQGSLDGAELFHPTMLPDYEAFREEAARASERPLLAIGSSDYHGGGGLGRIRTIVLAESRTAEGLMAALRAGRVVAAAPDGRLAGDEATLETLRGYTRQPAPPAGWQARALGWLGLAVLVASLFRRRIVGIP